MMKICAAILLLAATLAWSGGRAHAGNVAAIVEAVSGRASGVQEMDLLQEGRVIKLDAGMTLTLGYLRSCIREMITGGKVTVGRNQSKVENGKRRAEEVYCDGGSAIKPHKRGSEIAGAVFRKGGARRKTLPKPQWTLYGTKPVLRLSKPTKRIVIERLDKEGYGPIDLAVKGAFVDLSKLGVQLDPSGLYAISDGSATYVLKVSPLAEQKAPLLSRLVPM